MGKKIEWESFQIFEPISKFFISMALNKSFPFLVSLTVKRNECN